MAEGKADADDPLAAFTAATTENDLCSSLLSLSTSIEARGITLAKRDLLSAARDKKAGLGEAAWTKAVAALLGKALKSFDATGKVEEAPPLPEFVRFRMGTAVSSGGCRVRRGMSLDTDQVASIEWSSYPADVIHVAEVCGGGDWLKLHSSMLDDGAMGDALRASYNYSDFDIETEGYVARTIGGKTLFFEQTEGCRVFKFGANVASGGCRVRRGMSLDTDHIATIEWNVYPDNTVIVTAAEEGGDDAWLKLAPSMMTETLRASYAFEAFDIEEEGYVLRVSGAKVLFKEQ